MDAELLMSIFGDDLAMSDLTRHTRGDLSELDTALEGPGGPFDDMIPAVIEEDGEELAQARLSPGEFVLMQPVVSYLGDGDEQLGAGLLEVMQNNESALSEVKAVLQKYL